MLIPAVWLCALLLSAPAGTPNLLPGDGSFAAGPGPWQVSWSQRSDQPVRWADGALSVPVGARLGIERAVRLAPATVYTLACRASARDGRERLRLSLAGQSAEFVLSASRSTYQLTLKTSGEATDEPQDAWPELAITAPAGAPGLAIIDDLRLVEGPRAAQPEPRAALDLNWSDSLGEPLWQAADMTLAVRLRGAASATGGSLTLIDVGAERCGESAPRRTWPLDAPGPDWRVRLGDLPVGLYLAEATFATADGPLLARRYLPVLRSLAGVTLPEAWCADAAAEDVAQEAAAVGLRELRRVVTWSDLVDAQDAYRWRSLDDTLGPARAAGLTVTLVLNVSPAGTLPRGVAATNGQPELGRLLALTDALARHCAGQPMVYELDDEPWRTWGMGDYAEYLARFADAVRAADPAARVAGFGTGCEAKAGGRLAPYLAEAMGRDGRAVVDRVSWHLPFNLGVEPEHLWSTSLDALAGGVEAALGVTDDDVPAVAVVADGAASGPLEPMVTDSGPSPWQAAARTLRARLLSARAATQMTYASGWRGDNAALSVAINQWLSRYAGARFVDDLTLPDGLRGVRLALPDGRGLAAIWNALDQRATPAEPPSLGGMPRLTLPVDDLMAETLFGGHVPADRLALGFDPVFITAPNLDTLRGWLDAATIDDWQPARVGSRLEVRDRAPGLLLSLRNGARRPEPLPLAVHSDGGPTPTVGWLNPLLAPGDQQLWLPLGAFPEHAAGTLRLMAETGDHLADLSRTLWSWPEQPAFRALRADGDDADWADQPARTATTEDRLAAVDGAQWDGPDDASLSVRGDWRDGQLWLMVSVTDDVVTGGDALDIDLDLDPALPPVDSASEADHRLRVKPLVDGRAIGTLEFTRLEPDQPQAIDNTNLRLGFRAGTSGWSAELAVPLTPEAARRLDLSRVFSAQLTLTDDDGGGRAPSRLVFLGPPDDTRCLPQIWLANARVDHAGGADAITAPSPRRLAFADGPALTAEGFGTAQVTYVDTDDWIRGTRILRVTRRADDAASSITTLGQPGRIGIWVRASALDESTRRLGRAPRLGLRQGTSTRWYRPESGWCQVRATLDQPAVLLVDGAGTLDLAEVVWP